MLTILTLPFRLVAALIAAFVVIPTKLSARVLRFSTVATLRTTRFAMRSSIISFAAGVGAGWFLGTPAGRDLVDQVRGRIQGAPAGPGSAEPADARADLHPTDVDLPADAQADEVAGATPAV